MSIQSDVEMLSIEALEHYAHAHELSAKKAVHLFQVLLLTIIRWRLSNFTCPVS